MRKRTREIGLPIGYEVREEAKTVRRAFALKASVLEAFCDHLYNSRYGTKSIRQSKKMINGKLSKAVIATLPDGTEEEYPSMAEAQRQLGCSQGRISDACLGKIKTYHHGRKWRFKDATA